LVALYPEFFELEKTLKSLFSLSILVVIGFFIYKSFVHDGPTNALVNDSITETIAAAAKKGYKPCTNFNCCNYSKKGWHHRRTPGYPDSYVWLDYPGMSYSQNHVGHIVQTVNGRAADVGECPTCNGTGWIEKK
jgi:hypothetical protein